MSMTTHLSHRGFTLIEALVAVAILGLAVGGPLYAASSSLRAAQRAQSQLTAVYLAQEGLEYLRMMRDEEVIKDFHGAQGGAWENFLEKTEQCRTLPDESVKRCTFDPFVTTNAILSPCDTAGCGPLYVTGSPKRYVKTGATPSPYVRDIQIRLVPGSNSSSGEVVVVSTVSWDDRGTQRSVSVTDHLTSWQ